MGAPGEWSGSGYISLPFPLGVQEWWFSPAIPLVPFAQDHLGYSTENPTPQKSFCLGQNDSPSPYLNSGYVWGHRDPCCLESSGSQSVVSTLVRSHHLRTEICVVARLSGES